MQQGYRKSLQQFPIRGVEQMRADAKRAKTDPVWVATTKALLDKDFQQNELSSGDSEQGQKEEEDESEEQDRPIPKEVEVSSSSKKFEELEKRIVEVMQLKGIKEVNKRERKKKKKKEREYEESDFEEWKKWRKDRQWRRDKRSKRRGEKSPSSESSATSTSSSSEGEPLLREVGEKGSSGIFSCPFYKSDSRGFKDVRCQVQGQALTRRHIRLALYNLYSAYHTLESFADKFVAKAYASPNRPFTMDAAWFQASAENLDALLLNLLEGPWALWNEPVVDQMLMGFLELLIRVSPHKDYPVCLDDAVRKWMKKKRIGTNTKFGPVLFGMQHTKFTEGGIVIQQTSSLRNKEKGTTPAKQGSTNTYKTNPYPSQGGEKRPPPSS